MARESSFKNMTVSLCAICIACSVFLCFTYFLTEDTIIASEQAKVEEGVKAVLPRYDNSPVGEKFTMDEAEVYPATLAGDVVGYAILLPVDGFGGPMTILVGFTADGTVYNTSVLSHSETPGLGAKITDASASPRAQVKGSNPSVKKVAVVKDGGTIDAITASTITSRAFLKGINRASEIFVKTNESRK